MNKDYEYPFEEYTGGRSAGEIWQTDKKSWKRKKKIERKPELLLLHMFSC